MRIGKHEPKVQAGMRRLNHQMFLAICCEKAPFCFDDDPVTKNKIRSILPQL